MKSALAHLEFSALSLGHVDMDPLISECTFSFPDVACVRLRGQLGSGVSSLLLCLAGQLKPLSGKYLVEGVDVNGLDEKKFRAFQTTVGVAFDNGGLISHFSLAENLMLPLIYHTETSEKEVNELAYQRLNQFGVAICAALRPGTVSTGTKKAAALARALILDPSIVILDEPTQGLSQEGIKTLVELLKIHCQERGLKRIVCATEDDRFLSHFENATVEIKDRKLQLVESVEVKRAS